ncbi:MAG: S1 family peptidase [bacterium]|nr:S1 family peptidase [bacterium]
MIGADGRWATGFMISDNQLVTAGHVAIALDYPWSIHANVPPSVGGVVAMPLPEDQFLVSDANQAQVVLGSPFLAGHDWAIATVEGNGVRNPGENCLAQYSCGFDANDAGRVVTVSGFGLDDEPERNGVLQSDTGPSVGGGVNAYDVRYQLDTRESNSGSPIIDETGLIVGVHAFGNCGGTDTIPLGDNGGSLFSNPGFLQALEDVAGKVVCDGASGLAVPVPVQSRPWRNLLVASLLALSLAFQSISPRSISPPLYKSTISDSDRTPRQIAME